ncbi:MAG: hypothetical protein ACOYT4_03335 [Nanoarchaeota archaeon]
MWGEIFLENVYRIYSLIPSNLQLLFLLAFFTALIAFYSIFTFYFYKLIASKNILDLNLNQYNKSDHIVFMKILAVIFYILEYMIIFPLLTIFWFIVFSILLLSLSTINDVFIVLTICASLIASVRLTAYINENISRELAKIIPLTLLLFSLTQPNFFSIEAISNRFAQLPSLFSDFPYFILFIVILEFILRIGTLFISINFKNTE